MPELKRSLSISPLLSEDVIVRDYTKGIENQLGEKPKIDTYKAPQPDQPKPDPLPDPQPDPQAFNHSFTEPKGFQFQEDVDPSDIQTGEQSAADVNIASDSAKAFANVIGDVVMTKVPEIGYQYAKIDISSIDMHIARGNIHPGMRPVYQQVNINTFEALQFSDDEKKMFKKALKGYLEYKKIEAANEETAFWITVVILGTSFTMKLNHVMKENNNAIKDGINSYNPGFFDSFAGKQADAVKPEPKAAPAATPSQPGDKIKEAQTEKTTL